MDAAYAAAYSFLYRNHWWWQARAVIVREALERCVLPADASILDVGCGDGLSFPLLEEFGQVWGVEVDDDLLDPGGRFRDRIYTEPIGSPAYDSSRYDLITALDVLEHMEDDAAALASIEEMLRPGGWVVVTVPAGPRLWTTHDEVNQHFRRYTRRDLERLLRAHVDVLESRYLFASLVVPKYLLAQLERLRLAPGTAGSQASVPPRPVNALLRRALIVDTGIGQALRLPFGSSLIAIARKRAARKR